MGGSSRDMEPRMLLRKSIFASKRELRNIFLLGLLYTALAFAYSLIGFIHPQFGPHYNEYAPSKLLIEILGHFTFGFIAALPLVDIDLSILAGGCAVLIDSDHLLSALNFNVTGRPDHSFLYAVLSAFILAYFAGRLNMPGRTLVKMTFLAPIIVFSHIAFDIFAGTGSNFQFLIPFSFATQTPPYFSWTIFEGIAIIFSFLAYLCAAKWSAGTRTLALEAESIRTTDDLRKKK